MIQNTTQESNDARCSAQSGNAREDRCESASPPFANQLREGGRELLVAGKQRLVARIGCYESAVLDASAKLRAEDHVVLARQLEGAVDSMGGARQYLGERSPEQLLEEVGDVCRRHPATFFAGAFMAGLAAARFLKAGTPENDNGNNGGAKHEGDSGE